MAEIIQCHDSNDDAFYHDLYFLSITNSFKLFDQNLSLTAGEPSKMSEMMALNISIRSTDVPDGKVSDRQKQSSSLSS